MNLRVFLFNKTGDFGWLLLVRCSALFVSDFLFRGFVLDFRFGASFFSFWRFVPANICIGKVGFL